MHKTLAVLLGASLGLLLACSSAATVTDTPDPETQPAPPPTVLALRNPTSTPQIEPTPDPLLEPRATVTAWLSENAPPYTVVQLRRLQTLFGSGGRPVGLYSSGTNQETGQLTFEVLTPRSKTLIEQQAARLGIPETLLSVKVRKQISPEDPPVQTHSASGIELTLDIPEPSSVGAIVTFQILLQNKSDRAVDIETSTPPTVDVVVLSLDGDQLWRYLAPVLAGTGGSVDLDAGGVSKFAVPWNRLDDDGFALPPGQYLARGFAHIREHQRDRSVPIDLATAAVPFTLIAP